MPELAGHAPAGAADLPRRKLRAEFWGRVTRALALPLLPLLAAPLSLASKRGGRALSLLAAAAVLFGFQHLLQLGQGLGGHGRLPPLPAAAAPLALFAALCVIVWIGGRARPGATPVSQVAETLGAAVARLRAAVGGGGEPTRLGTAA